ncbi:Gaa1-like, GPI transamidase component [Nitzschia inconspicua]|uniref:Gaa1-like, GPI transamidase component n=1 Tax=Nitzschia inconspicua TaxID=303405 RepID=A0A9K3LHF2_9STRA|nr:Gaa1-like, GPI transamidase component [Nitzschia inconspicua]
MTVAVDAVTSVTNVPDYPTETDETSNSLNHRNELKNENTNDDDKDEKRKHKNDHQRFHHRMLHKLLFVSYLLGIVWTCLHPAMSILTGECKCRGWFLDEHSLEIRFVEAYTKQNSLEVPSFFNPSRTVVGTSLCDNLKQQQQQEGESSTSSSSSSTSSTTGGSINKSQTVVCHTHDNKFHLVMVQPRSNALDATEEALVVVLPSLHMSLDNDGNGSKLHKSLLQGIENLADPIQTPWLAKTVYFVTPTSDTISLDEAVSMFLTAYLGRHDNNDVVMRTKPTKNHRQHGNHDDDDHDDDSTDIPLLPPELSTAMLRNLIVVNVTDSSVTTTQGRGGNNNNNNKQLSGKTHLAILPQGHNGVLPNGDLVFLVGKLLERTSFMSSRFYPYTGSTFLSHGYTQVFVHASATVRSLLQHPTLQQLFTKLANMPKMMERQIQTYADDFVNMFLFARTLAYGPIPPHAAALQRGIDSVTIQVQFEGTYKRDPAEELIQYLLYLIRSLANLHERLHHSVTLYLLPTPKTFVSHMEYFLPNILILLPLAIRAFGLLLPAIISSQTNHFNTKNNNNHQNDDQYSTPSSTTRQKKVRMFQFALCVIAAHVLVPIAFAHTTLAYIPSLVITPLLAFPDYAGWITR